MTVSLTNREADIMAVLWEHGPSTVTEVRERLSDDLAYTTVLTILRTLEAKQYVTHQAEGRAHRFAARIQQQHARRSAIRHLAGKLFKGSSELLLTQLVSDRRLTEDQVERIRKILDEKPAVPRSSSPRRRGSSWLKGMDSRLRGNDEGEKS